MSSTPLDISVPADNATQRLEQLRSLTAAYKSATPAEHYLPPLESPLPALLALRSTHNIVGETKACISTTQAQLTSSQKRLEKEQADLRDARLVGTSLEARIESLRREIDERSQKTRTQVAKVLAKDLSRKRQHYESETGRLVQAFNDFVDDHLAPMLAAEELGGPVVGELLGIDDATLAAGFNTQGKAKTKGNAPSEDKRQRRIDQIWGQQTTGESDEETQRFERGAAAAEMRELTEELLNNLVNSQETGSSPYVELPRESAAARYLVRSKVAQFHPKDARRLRLVDFGRDLDD